MSEGLSEGLSDNDIIEGLRDNDIIEVTIPELLEELKQVHGTGSERNVYAFIESDHGIIQGEPVRPILPINMNLLFIASRGYIHLGVNDKPVSKFVREDVLYLMAMKTAIESGSIFHDDDGCLTTSGEKLLAELNSIIGTGREYKYYY